VSANFVAIRHWIEAQQSVWLNLLQVWASQPSFSQDTQALNKMADVLDVFFTQQGFHVNRTATTPSKVLNKHLDWETHESGPLLHFSKPGQKSVLLCGHYDTVYPTPLHKAPVLESATLLRGSGVADMKGGLVVIAGVLQALSFFNLWPDLGFEVVLVPDEEIGSVGSIEFLEKAAKRHQLGLVFEPCLPNGDRVLQRKGSVNVVIEALGLSAHAGRDLSKGKNAIEALATAALQFKQTICDTVQVNIGQFVGGTAANVVPKEAKSVINIRSFEPHDLEKSLTDLKTILNEVEAKTGVHFTVTTLSQRPPKTGVPSATKLLPHPESPHSDISLISSGGVSDANTLEAAGLPTLDTLGVRGGNLHSPDEWMDPNSIGQGVEFVLRLLQEFMK